MTQVSGFHPTPFSPPRPNIAFNVAWVSGRESIYLEEALASGHLTGDGTFGKRCEYMLQHELGVHRAMMTPSCTHALELAAILLDIEPGDEVIVPSFTFVSTINAFVLRGAKPVFVDIRPDTLNMDERLIEELLSPKTRAIVPVHYAGVGAEMDQIMAIANANEIPVVEDNAHALFAKYRGQCLGTFGALATQSFHETKNFSSGEGGALLINDPTLVERAEIIREKGTNRSGFFRGQVDKYTWVDVGSSFLPSEFQSAVLFAQLEARQRIQARRQRIWERYNAELPSWATQHGVSLPHVPEDCEQAYHMFYMLMPDLEARTRLISHLQSQGIQAPFHYVPLHTSAMGLRFGGTEGLCPVTESVSDRLIRLPFHTGLEPADQDRVVEAVQSWAP